MGARVMSTVDSVGAGRRGGFGRWHRALSVRVCVAGTLSGLGIAVFGQILVQRTFATVQHPTSLFEANLTMNPDEVRGHYAVLEERGTFDNMVRTELVDFVWMAGLALFVFSVTTLVAKLLRTRSPVASGRLMRWAPWTPLVAAFDVVENAGSLAMLADPWGFPDWLAYVHAGASVFKLAATVVVAVGIPAYALIAAVRGGRQEPSVPTGPRSLE
jgi:hypothetical protein